MYADFVIEVYNFLHFALTGPLDFTIDTGRRLDIYYLLCDNIDIVIMHRTTSNTSMNTDDNTRGGARAGRSAERDDMRRLQLQLSSQMRGPVFERESVTADL
jgi:hypothetical protein